MTYTIAEPCVDIKDKACIEECPVDCIYEGARMLYIHPDECVDCGACEPVCPVEAIYYEDDVPEQWGQYTQINADFFVELGSPGGAAKVGLTENDPQVVKDLAPQGEGDLAGRCRRSPGWAGRRWRPPCRSSPGTLWPTLRRWPRRIGTESSTCPSEPRSIPSRP